eukprot:354619-Chlamydomonas_euryale.AAC.8
MGSGWERPACGKGRVGRTPACGWAEAAWTGTSQKGAKPMEGRPKPATSRLRTLCDDSRAGKMDARASCMRG